MKTEKLVKILGIAITVAGAGLSIAATWVGDKQMEITIEEKVREAMLEMVNNKES